MKIIIAGSRNIPEIRVNIDNILKESNLALTELVCGMARGVDIYAFHWATIKNIPIKKFPADWNKYGKSAGFIRNKQMAEYADALIAIWDGKSKGTKHMIKTMGEIQKPVFIYPF